MVRGQIFEDLSSLKTLCYTNVFSPSMSKPKVYEMEHRYKNEFLPELEMNDAIVATPQCALSLSETEWAKENLIVKIPVLLSWLADEHWRTEVFVNNGDIYCASSSAMFGVPVEKHGQNVELRQKGKIAELALEIWRLCRRFEIYGSDRDGASGRETAAACGFLAVCEPEYREVLMGC